MDNFYLEIWKRLNLNIKMTVFTRHPPQIKSTAMWKYRKGFVLLILGKCKLNNAKDYLQRIEFLGFFPSKFRRV